MSARFLLLVALLLAILGGCGQGANLPVSARSAWVKAMGAPDSERPFPSGFLWGVATSGHQLEGGDRSSNWAVWEETGHGETPCGIADDEYDRYEADLDLAQAMGLKAFRMSLEWSRIEPERGVFDPSAIAHYHAEIRAILAHGLVPIVTMMHFTYPSWLDEPTSQGPGGWESVSTLMAFDRYAALVAREYAPEVRYWITINEPNTEALCGYLLGVFPPGKHDPLAYSRVLGHLEQAHRLAYAELHAVRPDVMVSINPFIFRTREASYATQAMNPTETAILDVAYEAHALDYVAFDYYYPISPQDWPKLWHAWTWPVYPEGLYASCKELYARYKLPLLVAENGMATDGDRPRSDGWTRSAFLVNHLAQLRRAMAEGVPVMGYMYWSLVDNYEWGSYDPCFGLFAIDRRDPTLHRIRTRAVDTYTAIAQANGLPFSLLARYLGKKN